MTPKKVVGVDLSEVFFTSVFSVWRMKQVTGKAMPIEWMVLRKLFSYIKAYPDHEVYLFADGTQGWRKQVDPTYKAQRKEQRDKYVDIDWPDIFAKYAQLLSAIDLYTPMNVFRDDMLEADDLEAVLAKDGTEVVFFSSDKDLNQLAIYPNVTLISPKAKKVKNKFQVRVVENPIKELDKLVRSGDRADNIPAAKDEARKIINNKLVNLIQLPPEIEERCRTVLNQERYKSPNFEAFCSLYPWDFVGTELARRWKDGGQA